MYKLAEFTILILVKALCTLPKLIFILIKQFVFKTMCSSIEVPVPHYISKEALFGQSSLPRGLVNARIPKFSNRQEDCGGGIQVCT